MTTYDAPLVSADRRSNQDRDLYLQALAVLIVIALALF